LQVPSFPQLLAPPSVHCVAGVGTWPDGTFAQVPTLPVSAQDLQVPVQLVAQQTPCEQLPELHSTVVVQVAPFGFLPQLLFIQMFGDTQSVAVVAQSCRQALLAPQVYGSHFEAVPARQTPEPSQVPADVSVDPTQVGPAHCVPATNLRQAPAPLQVPSLPQVLAAAATHWVAGFGMAPAGIVVQVPTVPVRLQAMQVPAHPVLQQMPCSQ
jgi:hypothetical protein